MMYSYIHYEYSLYNSNERCGKMKRLKCVGAILLALALIVGLLPVGVFHTHASATEAQNHGEVVQPSVDDGVTYIHAAYAANTITVDGALGLATTQTGTTEPAYRRQLSLPNGERFTVAWNLENLYVAATANITELKIAGVTVDLTAQEFQNEIQLFLDSLGINNLAAGYAFSIKVSGMTEAWTGTLVFDSSTYVTDAYTFGGGWGEYLVDGNPWKVQLDTYYNNETAEAANIRWRDIYNPSAIPGLYADFNASTVAEFDITIEHLKEITLTDGEIAFVEDYNFLTFGVSVTLNDDDASKTEAMQYGLYRLDNKLWFVCWDVDGFKSYEICNYADAENKTFHIRAELTYQPTAEVTDENKNEQNNIVAADFYVDGKLVAHSENAKRQFETLGQTASLGMFKVYTQGDHAITARTDVTLANVSANHKLPWLENFKQLTVSAGENYIHAAYADMDKDGETDANALRLNAPLSLYANARVGAAWDWENLYLSFTPDSGVTGVKVGGFEKAVTEDAVTIAWEDVLGHCLKANEISTEFAITITAEDAVLAGTLLLDTNDYHPEVQNTQTGDVTLDVVGTGPNAGPNQMLWGAGRLTPQAAVTIYDVDVDINSMNEGLVRELTGAGKVQSTYGLNFFLADSLAKAETAKATFFKFGLFRGSNDVVYLAYCNDTNYDEIVASGTETKDVITAVPVGIMGSGTFHIRVEYTYHDDDGNGYDLADRVSAVYYVNGKKVAEAESVRSVALMGSSVVGTAAGGVFVRPSIVCNVTVSNSSVSHANKNIVNDKAAADAVIAQIEEIGEVTLEDEAAIAAAEEAYGQLTEEQQKLVTNYDDLVAAKAAYAELRLLPTSLRKIRLLPML